MNNVFILQHLHVVDSDTEDVKLLASINLAKKPLLPLISSSQKADS
ncbi:hypothetical protein MHM98_16940 [Psychrobium sp. MM17-31]|nr:hypothetical protein [Psychrobium sp. MM17-31]MCG7533018.1 hypothetical protein [Psychrobium sp. MM17-31]